ncbi:uncharacterized protein LOC144444597 [Glandiceps talaboti]
MLRNLFGSSPEASSQSRVEERVDETFKMYVRYVHGGQNPIPIECFGKDTVHELARKLKLNAEKFQLRAGDIDESDLDIFQIEENGNRKKLHPRVKLSTVCNSDIEFDDGSFQIFVGHINHTSMCMFTCREINTVYDLTDKLKERIHDFGLSESDMELVLMNEGRIQLYKKSTHSGGINTPLTMQDKLKDMKNIELVFNIISKTVDIANVEKKCCGQNIAFFGGPSHGKSSTINTLVKSMQGFHHHLAQTFTGVHSGTRNYTPYRIDVNEKRFSLWDVPGTSLASQLRQHATDCRMIISRILDGKLPALNGIEGPFRAIGSVADKIHAIVCVQKGNADVEGIHALVIEEARNRDRSIPVFVIISHHDLMEPKDVEEKVAAMSSTFGIDKSAIFTISNFDHSASSYHDDPQRDRYVLAMLWHILSAAYTYKSRGLVKIGEGQSSDDVDVVHEEQPPQPVPEVRSRNTRGREPDPCLVL